MSEYRFPEQKIIYSEKPYSGEFMSGAFAEIFASHRPFTGFFKITTGTGTIYFLFFLRNDPYAAGKFTGHKPADISLAELFEEIGGRPEHQFKVSLHETDPVLLKCMLVFLKEDPTAKAPVDLINLEQVTHQIQEQEGDALIVLERKRLLNFFFFKNGKAATAHLADTEFMPPADLSLDEQMLVYAFQGGEDPIIASIYRSLATPQAHDAEELTRDMLMEMVLAPVEEAGEFSGRTEVLPAIPTITLQILSGPQNGSEFTLPLPCFIGRKEGNLVLSDALVSRRHAVIQLIDGEVWIEDLGSTNGTLVNGEEVKQRVISPSDLLTVGETVLRIRQ